MKRLERCFNVSVHHHASAYDNQLDLTWTLTNSLDAQGSVEINHRQDSLRLWDRPIRLCWGAPQRLHVASSSGQGYRRDKGRRRMNGVHKPGFSKTKSRPYIQNRQFGINDEGVRESPSSTFTRTHPPGIVEALSVLLRAHFETNEQVPHWSLPQSQHCAINNSG